MSLVLFGTVSQCCYATSILDGIIYIALCALVGRRPSARAALRCTLYTYLRYLKFRKELVLIFNKILCSLRWTGELAPAFRS